MEPSWFPVREVRQELADTVTLELEPPGGAFSFLPGQFTMLYAFGVGEIPLSITGDPHDSGSLIQTIRGVGAVSEALTALRPGDRVGVRGPFGKPWPVDAARGGDVVIVAGGIGLAPLRPVVYDILTRRDEFGRVFVLYGARAPDELLFSDQLRGWRSRFDLEVMLTVDGAEHGWHGSVGVVPKLIKRADFDPETTTAFVCGPEVMIRFSATGLVKEGVVPTSIHVSMERNMQCGFGICGHCQFGPTFVCRDGPVYPWNEVRDLMLIKEI